MSQSNVSSWLPNLLGVLEIDGNGVPCPTLRAKLNFVGCTVADNAATGATDITPPGAAGTFIPPTGSGLVTVTGSALDIASKPVGAGFYTWAATPSSANLAALMTDETGTGSLVFGTAPLFKGTPGFNNPGNTFKYVWTPAAIAADRVLNLPLLAADDTLAVLAMAQALTSKTIVAASNTITDTSAALGDILRHDGTRFVRLARGSANQVLTTNAGATDIGWAAAAGGGSSAGATSGQVQTGNGAGGFLAPTNVIAGAGFQSWSANPAATGTLRLANTDTASFRTAANSADLVALSMDSNNRVHLGSAVAAMDRLILDAPSGGIIRGQFGGGATFGFSVTTTGFGVGVPIVGDTGQPAPYSGHGGVAVTAGSDADITLSAAQYSLDFIELTLTAWTIDRNVIAPAPSTKAFGYYKTFKNTSATRSAIISMGGVTFTVAPSTTKRVWIDNVGCYPGHI